MLEIPEVGSKGETPLFLPLGHVRWGCAMGLDGFWVFAMGFLGLDCFQVFRMGFLGSGMRDGLLEQSRQPIGGLKTSMSTH